MSNKTRFAAKALAGTLVTTLLVLGSAAGPASAKKDTGWGVSSSGSGTSATLRKDTGWG